MEKVLFFTNPGGLRSTTQTLPATRLVNIIHTANAAQDLGFPIPIKPPPDTGPTLAALSRQLDPSIQPLQDWIRVPILLLTATSPHTSSKWWHDHVAYKTLDNLQTTAIGRDIPRLKSTATGHGSAWMSAIPSATHCTIIQPAYYKLAMRWWLGLPLSVNAPSCLATPQPTHLATT